MLALAEKPMSAWLAAAQSDPVSFQATLDEFRRRDPQGLMALLWGVQTQLLMAKMEAFGRASTVAPPGSALSFPLVMGQPVTHPGIPFDQWESGNNVIELRLIPDFLRDKTGAPVHMYGRDALAAVAAFNGGKKRSEGATAEGIEEGRFRSGTIILARCTDLQKIARERTTHPALGNINKIITDGADRVKTAPGWALERDADDRDSVCVASPKRWSDGGVPCVRLGDGNTTLSDYDFCRGRVLMLRGYTCG
jgi:hypothetical protein